jgi:hypothetical protein
VNDDYDQPSPPVERYRKYLIRDIYGRVWKYSNPLRIDERFTYIAGTGKMPLPDSSGWSQANGEIDHDSTMKDFYQNQLIFGGNPEVDYWQQYYVTGFNAPGFSLPGVPTLGPIQNAIPLMILSPNPNLPGACTFFGTQGIALRADYVGVNGDHGPSGTCAW